MFKTTKRCLFVQSFHYTILGDKNIFHSNKWAHTVADFWQLSFIFKRRLSLVLPLFKQ